MDDDACTRHPALSATIGQAISGRPTNQRHRQHQTRQGSLRHPIRQVRTTPPSSTQATSTPRRRHWKTSRAPTPQTQPLRPVLRPKGVMSRLKPEIGVTARICTLYRDFSARSDSRFTTSAPMHRTPIKTGRKTGWVQITTTIPKGIYIHAMSTNTKRAIRKTTEPST